MTLYTCGQRGNGPAALHPCAKAVRALRDAGHQFEIETVGGYRALFWTRRDPAVRAKVRELSGQDNVPILVLDDGEVISGSGTIARWAKEHPAA
jgi:glutathione S-transferase